MFLLIYKNSATFGKNKLSQFTLFFLIVKHLQLPTYYNLNVFKKFRILWRAAFNEVLGHGLDNPALLLIVIQLNHSDLRNVSSYKQIYYYLSSLLIRWIYHQWISNSITRNKLTCSDVAIHLTLPYTSGWVWYKGLDFYFFFSPPPSFRAVSFCIFSLLAANWLWQNLVELGLRD